MSVACQQVTFTFIITKHETFTCIFVPLTQLKRLCKFFPLPLVVGARLPSPPLAMPISVLEYIDCASLKWQFFASFSIANFLLYHIVSYHWHNLVIIDSLSFRLWIPQVSPSQLCRLFTHPDPMRPLVWDSTSRWLGLVRWCLFVFHLMSLHFWGYFNDGARARHVHTISVLPHVSCL